MRITTISELTIASIVHNVDIDLLAFTAFLEKRVVVPTTIPDPSCLDSDNADGTFSSAQALTLIANGLNIWDQDTENTFAQTWCTNIKTKFAAFPSNTQAVERSVKTQNLVASNGCGKKSLGIQLAATWKLLEMSK